MSIAASGFSRPTPSDPPLLSWRIPIWKSLFALAVFLPFSILFGAIFAQFLGRGLFDSRIANLDFLILLVAGLAATLALFVFFAETWIVAGAALFVRSAHAGIGLDELHHFQLKRPIRLASVRTVKVHGGLRVRSIAVTIASDEPIALRFPSLLNIKRYLPLSDASRTFTFMPLALSDNLVPALSRVVRMHGGQVVHR